MSQFLQETISGDAFELLIDTNIFPKEIILKAAYNLLDKGYFFFKYDANKNIILEFTRKQDITLDPRVVIGEFSDELLDVYLRDKLEKENRVIREAIVTKAIEGPLDLENFVSLDTDKSPGGDMQNEIDFDKDIDDILREIENDPDLQIDEGEIDKILKEIEEEAAMQEVIKPEIKLNPDNISAIKKSFTHKKD